MKKFQIFFPILKINWDAQGDQFRLGLLVCSSEKIRYTGFRKLYEEHI